MVTMVNMVTKNIKRAENSYFILYSKYIMCMFFMGITRFKIVLKTSKNK